MRYVGIVLFVAAVSLVAYIFAGEVAKLPSKTRRDAVVRLVSGGNTFCSGAVISDTTVITAAHCVVMELPAGLGLVARDGITIRNDDNIDTNTVAKVKSVRIQMDQATLEGDFRDFQHADYQGDITELIKISDSKADLRACGYPFGGSLVCTKIKLNSLRGFFWSGQGILIPGMSGGPVFFHTRFYGDKTVAVNTAMGDDGSAIVSPLYNVKAEK